MEFTNDKLKFSDNEMQDLITLLICGIEHLKEYNDTRFLTAHPIEYYEELIRPLVD